MILGQIAKQFEIIIFQNLVQNPFFYYICIMMEFIQITLNLFHILIKINKNLNQFSNIGLINTGIMMTNFTNKNNNSTFIHDYLRYVSFSHQMRSFITCNSLKVEIHNQISNFEICEYSDFLFIIIVIVIILHILTFCIIGLMKNKKDECNVKFLNKLKENENHQKKCFCNLGILIYLISNFFEILFLIFGEFILELLINKILINISSILHFTNTEISLFKFITSLFSIILYLLSNVFYLKNINILVQFSPIRKCPYDNLFSKNYGMMLLLLKVIYSFEFNLSLLNISNKSVLIYFIISSTLILFLFFIMTGIQLINRNIIFYANINYNKLRLFNLIFLNFLIIFEIYFKSYFYYNLISISILLLSLFLGILLMNLFLQINIKNLLHINNFPYQVGYILNKKIEDPSNLIKIVDYLVINHSRLCINKNCKINLISDLDNLDEIFDKFRFELKNNSIHRFLPHQEELKIISLALLDTRDEKNLNKKLISLFFILNKFKDRNNNNKKILIMIFINLFDIIGNRYSSCDQNALLLNPHNNKNDKISLYENNKIYSKINNNQQNFNLNCKNFINFELLKLYLESFLEFKLAFKLFSNSLLSLNSLRFDNLFEDSLKLNKAKCSIINKYEIINKFKSEYENIYSLFIIKFIFKNLFNEKLYLENEIILPNEIDSLINSYFLNDNFINILSSQNTFKIIQVSKDFIEFKEKDFFSLFPEFCRNHYKKKFYEYIQKSDGNKFNGEFIFEFYNRENRKISLKIYDYICHIYPNYLLSEIVLSFKCQYIEDDILVFENHLKNPSNNLIMCTDLISKKICLDNFILNLVKENGINFDNIFTIFKKPFIHHNTDNENLLEDSYKPIFYLNKNNFQSKIFEIDSKKMIYYINYIQYKIPFFNLLHLLKEKEYLNLDECIDIKLNFEKEKIKLYFFQINLYDDFENKFINYKIYRLKKCNPKKNYNNNKIDLEDDNLNENLNNISYRIINQDINEIILNSKNSNLYCKSDTRLISERKFTDIEINLFKDNGFKSKKISHDEGINNIKFTDRSQSNSSILKGKKNHFILIIKFFHLCNYW